MHITSYLNILQNNCSTIVSNLCPILTSINAATDVKRLQEQNRILYLILMKQQRLTRESNGCIGGGIAISSVSSGDLSASTDSREGSADTLALKGSGLGAWLGTALVAVITSCSPCSCKTESYRSITYSIYNISMLHYLIKSTFKELC